MLWTGMEWIPTNSFIEQQPLRAINYLASMLLWMVTHQAEEGKLLE